ncbi:biotin/lipoyl-containing protein [Thalassomonas actiniarum]|uniref:Lipoyl-binding domain-containing protein n=1 Tax=Thalassomonas actiniarum TaxID=485447 RepID=A0AAF0C3W9_9GAMM|nr:biotin/lipoyl-containing protein [Thalassomonas actiniarum]WDD99174.1 hypothetical protein SG35_000345 [Thalassomonas actiniarum]
MKAGKLGLVALIFNSLNAFAGDIHVHLFERPSDLLISRHSGEIIEIAAKPGAQVARGDVILSVRDDKNVWHVRSSTRGAIELYSKTIAIGERLHQGDIIAEIISNDITGELRITSEQGNSYNLDLDGIYCCLYLRGKAFEIKIEDALVNINRQLYYFSVISPGPELFRFLDDVVNEQAELVMKLSFDNNGEANSG